MWKLIFWIIVLTLALSYFGISIQSIVASPAGQENFAYLLTLAGQIIQWMVSTGLQFITGISAAH